MAKNTVIVSVLADTKQLKSGFQDGTKSVLGRVTSLGKGIAKTALGVTAAVVGMAAAGGFARALKLDEARTQLKALGYDGQTMQGIMNSALASVKGTAFGLDSAATIAAQALASGIKPGQQLTASLTTVANTAALAKTDMGEMGSIFSKVWANGKVTTMEMNQLADRGVPIWQYLGKTFNVSNAELRKMIEGGKITADMFMNSLGPAVDGMATRMSGGFKGMAMNAMAALSRVGAMFAGPLLDSAKGFLGEATTLTDGLGARLQPVADRWAAFLGSFSTSGLASGALGFLDKILAAVPGVIRFVTSFSPLSVLLRALAPVFPQLAASLMQLGQALANSLVALGPSLVDVLGSVLTLAAQIIPPIASLASTAIQVAAGIVTWTIVNRDWLTGLAVAGTVIGGVVAAVSAYKAVQLGVVAATYGAQGAMLVAGGSAKVYGAAIKVMSTWQKVSAAAQWAWNAAMTANPIGIIVTAIAALVAGLVYFFTQTKLGKQIWGEFTRFLTEAWKNIVSVAQTVFGNLASFFSDLWGALTTGWNAVVDVVRPVFEFIGNLIKTYVEVWVNIIIVFAAVLKTIWDGIAAVITTVWNAIVAFIAPIVQQIVTVITTGVQLVQAGWRVAWGAISSFFTGIWNGIVSGVTGAVGKVVSVVGGIQSKVMSAVSGAGRWLLDAGRNVVQGLWNGISGMGGWLMSKITGFFDGVIGWAKSTLGIKSPSRVFMGMGGYIGQGLANGIQATTALVRGTTQRLAGTVIDAFSADLDGGQMNVTVAPNDQRGGNVYNITINALTPTPEIGRTVVDAIRQYEAAGGRA